jgi:hypothetical protein
MRRPALLAALAFAAGAGLASARSAHAEEGPDPEASGVTIVAEGEGEGIADVAWPLAQTTYGKASLRPKYLTEAQARVLVGEAPPADATVELKDLAQLRTAVRGDDTVSREILGNVGRRVHTKSILVVTPHDGAAPQVRLFDVTKKTFDPARWQPEPKEGGGWAWDATLGSVERALGPVAAPPVVKPKVVVASVAAAPVAKDKSKSFYESPWFWVALGGAALLGGAVILATHDWSGDMVHMRMQVPQ